MTETKTVTTDHTTRDADSLDETCPNVVLDHRKGFCSCICHQLVVISQTGHIT